MSFTYEFPRPSVAVDAVVFACISTGSWPSHVLLIQRGQEPFKGAWALPGGFLDLDEELEVAVSRELKEETGLTVDHDMWSQVGAYGRIGRDPRGRTISVAYMLNLGHLLDEEAELKAGDDAAHAEWVPIKDALNKHPMAFGHETIIYDALIDYENMNYEPRRKRCANFAG